MKAATAKIYLPLFVIIILLQLYLPSFKLNIVIQLATLMFCLVLDYKNIAFSVKFIKQIVPFIVLFVLGFLGMLLYKYHPYNIIKDIFHFIKPLTGILLGYIIFRRVNNLKYFVLTIVVAGIISSFLHFFTIAFLVRSVKSIEDIREFTRDNFLDLFALFLLIYYKKFQVGKLFNSRLLTHIFIAVLALSCILYFSRTMIIVAVVLFFSISGLTRITPATIKLGGILIVSVILFYSFLYSIDISRGKPGIEGFLYKIKNAPEEVFRTRINREDHRDLWDHWRGYEMKRALALMDDQPESYVFGTGHGSLVNLKFFAPLTGEPKGIRYISELHNGYIYILYKTGIIGIIIYLFMLVRWYGYIYKNYTLPNVLVSAIGIIFMFSTLTITGTYNSRDIIIFILGGALFFSINKEDTQKILNNER